MSAVDLSTALPKLAENVLGACRGSIKQRNGNTFFTDWIAGPDEEGLYTIRIESGWYWCWTRDGKKVGIDFVRSDGTECGPDPGLDIVEFVPETEEQAKARGIEYGYLESDRIEFRT